MERINTQQIPPASQSLDLHIRHNRLDYLDALRGFTIFLVVYLHIIMLQVNHVDVLGFVFQRIRMPMFFFISGFFSFGINNVTTLKRRVINRVRRQLWPTLIVFYLFILVFSVPLLEALINESKEGYWFTICLFETFVIYALVTLFIIRLKLSRNYIVIIFGCLTIISFLMSSFIPHVFPDLWNSDFSSLICLNRLSNMSPYFYFGLLIRLYQNNFNRALQQILPLIAFFSIFICSYFLHHSIVIRLSSFIGIICLYSIFFRTKSYWASESLFPRTLKHIGKLTLPIYLFHYFIIELYQKIIETNNISLFTSNPILEIIIVSILAIITISCCLAIDQLIKRIKLVYNIIFEASISTV